MTYGRTKRLSRALIWPSKITKAGSMTLLVLATTIISQWLWVGSPRPWNAQSTTHHGEILHFPLLPLSANVLPCSSYCHLIMLLNALFVFLFNFHVLWGMMPSYSPQYLEMTFDIFKTIQFKTKRNMNIKEKEVIVFIDPLIMKYIF